MYQKKEKRSSKISKILMISWSNSTLPSFNEAPSLYEKVKEGKEKAKNKYPKGT